jgi:exopolysaccharide production protein ExoZ
MLQNVQALRGLAALLVVFVHLERLAALLGLWPGITVFGNCGVDVFFVISGLIMVVTTQRRADGPSAFLKKRITRIVPLYWAITLLVALIVVAAPSLLGSTTATPLQLLKSLLFIPYPRPDGAMHPVVFVGWTLNYEMMFYLLFTLGLFAPKRWQSLALTISLLVAAALAGQLGVLHDPVAKFYTAPIILEFGAGMLLGAALTSGRLPARRDAAVAAVAVGTAALLLMLLGPWLWPQFDRAIMFGIPAVVLVASGLIAEQGGLAISGRSIQTVGAASYSIYLTHFFCTQLVVKLALHFQGLGPIVPIAAVPATFILVVIVGVAAHFKLELPLTDLARRMLIPSRKETASVIPGGAW